MIKLYERLPDRVEAVQNTEANDDFLAGLSVLTPAQEGAYILKGLHENVVLMRGQWLIRAPNSPHWNVIHHFQFVQLYQEARHATGE